jgi:IS30 family transposase
MARLLGHSPSTVSREINRNGGYDRYRAALADEMAWARAHRPKRCKLANNPRLPQAVASKLRLNWSPEQIAGWLKRWRRGDGCNHVSHETIYRRLFVQTRGVLKKELLRTYLYGPAVCCKPDVSDGGIGLAHLYPARE